MMGDVGLRDVWQGIKELFWAVYFSFAAKTPDAGLTKHCYSDSLLNHDLLIPPVSIEEQNSQIVTFEAGFVNTIFSSLWFLFLYKALAALFSWLRSMGTFVCFQ